MIQVELEKIDVVSILYSIDFFTKGMKSPHENQQVHFKGEIKIPLFILSENLRYLC